MTTGRSKREQRQSIWYREPYVWLFFAFPLAAVIGSVITGKLALQSDDGLVVDDYYKQGLEINQVLKRDRLAHAFSIAAKIQIFQEQKTFRLMLTGNESFIPPDTITVSFLHSTRSGFDRKIQVARNDKNLYQAELPKLAKGRWYIQIETGDWRVLQTIRIE